MLSKANVTHFLCGPVSLIFLLSFTQIVAAFELNSEQVNGVYQLAQPERSAAGQTQKLRNQQKLPGTKQTESAADYSYSYLRKGDFTL